MDPYLNITVGHYNANTDHFKQLLDYSKDQKYKNAFNVAVPAGMWQKMDDIICNDEDREYLRKIRKEYKNLVRNVWNPFDRNHEKILGCTTVNRIYVTPIGDVLVCPYVHIKIGNIFKQSLKEIINYGFSIKYFSEHSNLCLAGEDKEFINKFMTKSGQTIFKPALAKDIFSKEDFVKVLLNLINNYLKWRKNFNFSAGAAGREINQLINSINLYKPTWSILGYVDDKISKKKKLDGLNVFSNNNKPKFKNIYAISGIMDAEKKEKNLWKRNYKI